MKKRTFSKIKTLAFNVMKTQNTVRLIALYSLNADIKLEFFFQSQTHIKYLRITKVLNVQAIPCEHESS